MKRIMSVLLLVCLMCSAAVAVSGTASAARVNDHITVNSFDPDIDYSAAIKKTLEAGDEYAMQIGAIYEKQRNLKIEKLKLKWEKTTYFDEYDTAKEILKAMEEAQKPAYTQEELDLLSRIIYAEAGCSWYPDWVQQLVGSVVLNRVESKYYPNTIREVIYQPGQYAPTWDGSINKTPDKRTIENAKFLLENGSICPANVVGQNSIITGSGVYKSYYDSVLNTTMYFCYA